MIKTATDSRIIQHAIDRVAERIPASLFLLRFVRLGHPESIVSAWAPHDDRAPLFIDLPVSKAERAAVTSQHSVFIEDAEREAGDEHLRTLAARLGARSIHFSPVIYDSQVIASIGLVGGGAPRRLTQDEQEQLARLTETLAPLILNAGLQEGLRNLVADLSLLLGLAVDVSSQSDLEKALIAVLDSWSKVAGADASAVLLWDEEAKRLRLTASKNLPTGIFERYTEGITLEDPVCGLAAMRLVGVVADLASEARFADLHAATRWANLRGAWATPVKGSRGKLLGVMVTFSRTVREIQAEEQRLADLFMRPAAVAIENREQQSKSHTREERVRQLRESLRQSEQHKAEFMSIISHELRTPLNAILGYAQMLSDGFSGDLNEQQREDVRTIINSADKLLRMIEDTLDLARMDMERFPVYMDHLALDEVVRRAVHSVESVAEAKGLKIKTHISPDVTAIRTDPERVRQILTSLLSNSVKFTDSGSIRVNVESAESGGVEISVEDTGIGFDAAAFPHLFEEFRQGDASTTRTHSGTGLGLAVSKRLVERLGGTIGANSTPGVGSVFWFRLPPEIPGAEE
ncbi:MAG: HAMP domain-containing histidine kinase [Acidobacteriota bacterium]|nr:HAMP domain-containing histidine kinase [Acidobacteriota bacterium]